MAGVIQFRAPRSSSAPQRPQFFVSSKMRSRYSRDARSAMARRIGARVRRCQSPRLCCDALDPPAHGPLPRQPIDRLLAPLDRFLHVEAAGGLVLLACTALALALANSPWSESWLH